MSAFIDARENGVTDKPLSRRSRGKTGSNAKIGRWPPENIQQIESQIFEILNGLDIVAPCPPQASHGLAGNPVSRLMSVFISLAGHKGTFVPF
ncbi:hypothetical protein [Ralstonia pseudosolanacearum]|uniref:hypothetical protein n=1 Tax=Ralstonia pseudosolanacearum TaxID=1310165 RepID=UPI000AF6C3DA|nr:hypothetical protein [Ralstonia pseudosolanacearum]QIK19819.1 hypothetical protein G7968_16165 [Ralstonia solanacearum]